MSGALAETTKEKFMLGKSNKQRIHESTVNALKKARIIKRLTRKELAEKLNVTFKAIEQVENGRNKLSEARLINYLNALNLTLEDFQKIRRSKKIIKVPRQKKVVRLVDRRSYKKIITKEARVLKTLRRIKDISQDSASSLCGYSRPTIGHIENGRIALSTDRISHILSCYGFSKKEFDLHCGKENLRDEVFDACMQKLKKIDDSKLDLIKGIIDSMA